jgi:hypothetical protein
MANHHGNEESQLRCELLRRDLSYDIEILDGNTRRRELVPLQGFHYSDTDRDALLQWITDPRVHFLTTALRQGLTESTELIRELLEARSSSEARRSMLMVIACENNIPAEFLECAAHFHGVGAIRHLPAIVDRMCSAPYVDDERVVVPVESYAKWLIEEMVSDLDGEIFLYEAMEPLVSNQTVRLTPGEEFRIELAKKRWLVNGGLLVAALLALEAEEPAVSLFLQRPEGLDAARRAIEELARAFAFQHDVPVDEVAAFGEDAISRFMRFPDTIRRVLQYLRPGTLERFITDLHARVGVAIRTALDQEEPPPFYLTLATCVAIQAVHDRRYVA